MGMLIEDYDGKQDPESVNFDGLFVWAQIHNIPELYRKLEIVDQLARRIGRVKETQLSPRLFYEGNYVRIRARVLVDKPLTRVIPLNVVGEGRRLLPVKYEKIPYFCQICGLMGHNHEECGDGVWEAKDKQWGSWMLAQRRETVQEQQGGGRASRGGRSGGWGRGRSGRSAPPPRQTSPVCKRSSQEAGLDPRAEDGEEDEVTSPLKPAATTETEHEGGQGARRNLNFALAGNNPDGHVQQQGAIKGSETGCGVGPDLGLALMAVPPPPPTYVSPRDAKKAKKSASPMKQNPNKMALLAGSDSGRRQAQ
ncbi:hypothetical protein VPH35_103957 [Triticum aestivum]